MLWDMFQVRAHLLEILFFLSDSQIPHSRQGTMAYFKDIKEYILLISIMVDENDHTLGLEHPRENPKYNFPNEKELSLYKVMPRII